jgi:FMN phosphatase YigB (HAD superfamily)
MTTVPLVFLVDVDNTLLDNDRIQDDLKRHLEREFGVASRDRYWAILEALFVELGYRDYLGAVQRYRVEHPRDVRLMRMSSYLVDYPFANRLYPGALDVLQRLRTWGPTVILSDGDVVFQPRKVERSGISEAVDGHVLIYIHKGKTLDDVERRYRPSTTSSWTTSRGSSLPSRTRGATASRRFSRARDSTPGMRRPIARPICRSSGSAIW